MAAFIVVEDNSRFIKKHENNKRVNGASYEVSASYAEKYQQQRREIESMKHQIILLIMIPQFIVLIEIMTVKARLYLLGALK